MSNIIYTTDEVNPVDIYGIENPTPYHLYYLTRDFSTILNDIKYDKIPVGTGNPFPVEFEDKRETNNGGVKITNDPFELF